jgi:hypothetical protein
MNETLKGEGKHFGRVRFRARDSVGLAVQV